MRVGLPLAVSRTMAPGAASFDPTTLSLTAYWRANYSASPWSGTASTGTSGSNTLSEATNPPGTGTAVNSYTPARFDGTNDQMTASGTVATYLGTRQFAGWVLWRPTAISDGWGDYTNVMMYVYLGSGPTYTMRYNAGASSDVSVACPGLNQYQLVTFRHTGSAYQIGVNTAPGAAGGASSQANTSNMSNRTGTIKIGQSAIVNWMNASVLEWGMTNTTLSDATFDQIKTYCNTRYGLAL